MILATRAHNIFVSEILWKIIKKAGENCVVRSGNLKSFCSALALATFSN